MLNDTTLAIIVLAFFIDTIIGDPQNPVHPIRMIGLMIACGVRLRKMCRICKPIGSFLFGALWCLVVVLTTYFVTKILLLWLTDIHYWLAFGVETVLCYFIISPKALKVESMKVCTAIQQGDLTRARKNLSRIVGRDTERLERSGIIKATVETVAENFSDGVIAPLFFVFVGGVPLGLAYKAVNTLDSMIGYRNEQNEYFGKFAARLDDIVNYIPARLSALLMIAATVLTGYDTKQAIHIYLSDRHKHKSPNSAQTEAVCAGALGICLGGENYYHGKLVSKPMIGYDTTTPEASHIVKANRLMCTATLLAIAIMIAIGLSWRLIHVSI